MPVGEEFRDGVGEDHRMTEPDVDGVVRESHTVAVAHPEEPDEARLAHRVHRGADYALDAEGVEGYVDAVLKGGDMVGDVGVAIHVTDYGLVRVRSRPDEHLGLLGAHRPLMGVDDDRDTRLPPGLCARLEEHHLVVGDGILAGGEFYDASLDPGAADSVSDLPSSSLLPRRGRSPGLTKLEVGRCPLAFIVRAGLADYLDLSPLGDLKQHLRVPTAVVQRPLSLDPVHLRPLGHVDACIDHDLTAVAPGRRVARVGGVAEEEVLVHQGLAELVGRHGPVTVLTVGAIAAPPLFALELFGNEAPLALLL